MALPRLRFKDFDENWRLLTLKQLINSLDAGVSVISEDIMPLDDEYSVLKTSCISLGYFNKNERKRVIKSKEIQRLKEPVLDDSIIISRMNTPLLVGMNAYVDKAPANTFLPDRLWQIKINNDLVMTLWLSFYLGSDGCLYKLRDLASGTSNSMKNITKPGVLSINLFVPSKKEQTKIASFLSSVDNKIAQLTQEHELLTQYKKGMMQQLFSQRMRFKADDGSDFEDWNEVQVADIFTVTRGKVLATSKTEPESGLEYKYPVFSSQTKKNGLMGFYPDYLFEDAITWTTDGANAGDVNFRKGKFYCTNVCGVLISDKGYANACIAAILDSISRKYVSYVGNPKLMNNIMAKIPIYIPSNVEEQTKIANFLSAIEQKIDNVAAQIDQAQVWKKGLLQQMFV
jgi:type I restriction enzyme S subunit